MVNESLIFNPEVPIESNQITLYLRKWIGSGDTQSRNEAYTLIYSHLYEIANRILSRERGAHRIQAEELVNEVFIRLNSGNLPLVCNRQHFYSICALTMRRIIIDLFRRCRCQTLGGNFILVSIHESIPLQGSKTIDILIFDEALKRLGAIDQELGQLVELRVFLGMTLDEIADVQNISLRKVKDNWKFAKHWLGRELS
jgi:RNA polymerase sigma-70 factor, ECF subfamily